MSTIPHDLRYTEGHLWARVDDEGRIVMGITDYAQERLAEMVFVELPASGRRVSAGQSLGEVESIRTISSIPAPVSGTVVDVNSQCIDDPTTINRDPYGVGWMLAIEPEGAQQYEALLSAADYEELVK